MHSPSDSRRSSGRLDLGTEARDMAGPTVAGGLAGTLAVLFLLVEIDWDLPASYFQWNDPFIQMVLVVDTLIAFAIGLGSGWLVTWFRTWW